MLRKESFTQWSTFYNSNGYLCLIHKIQNNKAQIVNYNGTFYSITLGTDKPSYQPSIMSADEFFNAFPHLFYGDKDNLERYYNIRNRFYVKKRPNLLLL